jgi:predicted transcriptional regulator
MEVNLSPDLAARLEHWAEQTGRGASELVADAMAGHFEELNRTREMLDRRYESMRSGEAQAIDGEEALHRLKKKNEARRHL